MSYSENCPKLNHPQWVITDFVMKCRAVQSETENANLIGVDSYSEPDLRKRSGSLFKLPVRIGEWTS